MSFPFQKDHVTKPEKKYTLYNFTAWFLRCVHISENNSSSTANFIHFKMNREHSLCEISFIFISTEQRQGNEVIINVYQFVVEVEMTSGQFLYHKKMSKEMM